jgi:hypothetical protein
VKPAERAAARLVATLGLVPPVDVPAVLERFATLEVAEIPGGCDGLVLGLGTACHDRPTVILNRTPNRARALFTLAHELGHILLPWHLGDSLACDTRTIASRNPHEAEANAFAGSLLLPSTWLETYVVGPAPDDVPRMLREIADTGVSAHVACIRLARHLPPGHVLAVLDLSSQTIELGVSSPETTGQAPAVGTDANDPLLTRFSDDTATVAYGHRRIRWWRHDGASLRNGAVVRDTTETLRRLLDEHLPDEAARHAAQQTLAGIVGHAKSRTDDATPEAIYGRIQRSLSQRRQRLLSDPSFDGWARQRAIEVADS